MIVVFLEWNVTQLLEIQVPLLRFELTYCYGPGLINDWYPRWESQDLRFVKTDYYYFRDLFWIRGE